jgi:triosephosphate isomerase
MRTSIIAGNWKMNTTIEAGLALAAQVVQRIDGASGVEKVVCPPFVHLPEMAPALRGTTVKLGAQNAHWEEKGAFTGEVSPAMLTGLVEYVIIGHSERRQYFGETDETVNRRLKGVLAAGLKPIMCIGETGDQRTAGETEAVLAQQVEEGLADIVPAASFVIAYEPVWAIGTGVAATADDAQTACSFIRSRLRERFGAVADEIRIQYGGSMNAKNAAEILANGDVDGGLIGGAALDADAFAAIVSAAAAK